MGGITSPYVLSSRLIGSINILLNDAYSAETDAKTLRLIERIKQLALEARLDCRDYELSETRTEQSENAEEAKKRLASLRETILVASQKDLFGAVDVAQLSIEIEEISGLLQ